MSQILPHIFWVIFFIFSPNLRKANRPMSYTSGATVQSRNSGSGIFCRKRVHRKKIKQKKLTEPNLTETNIFSYGELSYD